jgi:hypothetical protein
MNSTQANLCFSSSVLYDFLLLISYVADHVIPLSIITTSITSIYTTQICSIWLGLTYLHLSRNMEQDLILLNFLIIPLHRPPEIRYQLCSKVVSILGLCSCTSSKREEGEGTSYYIPNITPDDGPWSTSLR